MNSPRRHRSEYPPAMQEVGDLLELWDADGYLIPEPCGASPFALLGMRIAYGQGTPPQDSNP